MNTINDFMKTRFSKHVRFLLILGWAALAVAPRASAQTPPGLELQLYPGLRITGAVGTVYSVEHVTDPAQTNDWRCLTFLQPLATNCLWFDPKILQLGPTSCAPGDERPAAIRYGGVNSASTTLLNNKHRKNKSHDRIV